jgi:hypothetical protein
LLSLPEAHGVRAAKEDVVHSAYGALGHAEDTAAGTRGAAACGHNRRNGVHTRYEGTHHGNAIGEGVVIVDHKEGLALRITREVGKYVHSPEWSVKTEGFGKLAGNEFCHFVH